MFEELVLVVLDSDIEEGVALLVLDFDTVYEAYRLVLKPEVALRIVETASRQAVVHALSQASCP
jgi:hypothetical protein